MPRLLPLLIAAGAALGLPAAASADATITPTPGTPFQWSPADVDIQPGQKVTWDFSATAVPHNIIVLPQGADFPAAPPSTPADFTYLGQQPKTFAKTFSSAGTFRYLCSFHYSGGTPMRGTITVKDATPPPPPPPPATGSLPPEPVAVMSDRGGPFTVELFTLTGSESAFEQLSAFGGEGTDPAWNYDAADRKIAWDRQPRCT